MTTAITDPDQAARIRNVAVDVLRAQIPFSEPAKQIEAERIDAVETGSMPRIVVYGDETATSRTAAGGPLGFEVTLNLGVEIFVERAQAADAVAALDLLIAQVKDALFSDPVWTQMFRHVPSFHTTRKYTSDEMIVANARLLITCVWFENYPARPGTPLTTIAMRDGAQPVPQGAPPQYTVGADVALPQT